MAPWWWAAMSDLGDAALDYASRGWPVHPLWPDSKVPATMHGVRDATVDLELITRWWSNNAQWNVGVACGHPGPDVLDLDLYRGDAPAAALERINAAGLLAGAFAIVATPRGGRHYLFPGSDQRSRAWSKDHHIELKSAGGYIVAPPSVVDGNPYVLLEQRQPSGELLDGAAVDRLLRPPRRRGTLTYVHTLEHGLVDALVRWLGRQEVGNRNCALYWATCRALENGATDDDLDRLADAALTTGLPSREVSRTIDSARGRVSS